MATAIPESLEFSTRTDLDADDVLVIQLFGELDLHTCLILEPELRQAEVSMARRIVLDLSALQFIDSKGIELLVRTVKRLNVDGARLSLLRPPAAGGVGRMLALTGLDTFLPFDD